MKKSEQVLPENYKEIFSIDLQKDKKKAIFINALAFVIAIIMIVIASFFIPITELFSFENGMLDYSLRFITIIVATVAYIILHELVHGVAMKICGTKKIKYGFTGMYAFAGSDDFYYKKSYLFIALAPVVLWGIVLLVINFFVNANWFWVVYIVQISNISGAAGDFYVSAKFASLPDDILIKDHGVGMTVYSKAE